MRRLHIDNVSLPNFPKGFILILIIFSVAFFYLHQKVLLFVEAYQLRQNYYTLCDLVGKKDYLLQNFSNETTLAKVHQWTKKNNFVAAERERMIALNLRREKSTVAKSSLAFLFNRFLNIPPRLPRAVAEETN